MGLGRASMEKAGRESDGAPCGPVLHIVVVGFHHKKGCQVRTGPRLLGAPAAFLAVCLRELRDEPRGFGFSGRLTGEPCVLCQSPPTCWVSTHKGNLEENSAFGRRRVVSCGFPHECSSKTDALVSSARLPLFISCEPWNLLFGVSDRPRPLLFVPFKI